MSGDDVVTIQQKLPPEFYLRDARVVARERRKIARGQGRGKANVDAGRLDAAMWPA